jgi:hypothetical protein
VAEKADITMPELAGALDAGRGEKADPASLSRSCEDAWNVVPDFALNPSPPGTASGDPSGFAEGLGDGGRGDDRADPVRAFSERQGD